MKRASWTERRWAELAGQVATASPDWAEWAKRQLCGLKTGKKLVKTHGWAAQTPRASGPYDRQRPERERTAAGQFFTPAHVADALVQQVLDVGATLNGVVLDPACGAGELLLAVFRHRCAAGATTDRALAGLKGWDLDPKAAWGTVATLVEAALQHANGPIPNDLNGIRVADALSQVLEADTVLMNPPYLEAKRMNGARPGLRAALKAQFPKLSGTFDLYMAFLWCAENWIRPGGVVGAIVPNKVCQARYAASFPEEGGLGLVALDDLSRLRPRPFPGTSVYPVLICLMASPTQVRTRHIYVLDDLGTAPARTVDPAIYEAFDERPWFAPFETWPILQRCLGGPRLGDVTEIRSTCSFHKKGLRERFVTAERPETERAMRYIGGPSFARQGEVSPFKLDWAGWWIDFDQAALRALGNPLPSRDDVFERPKVVLRQHARRPEAWVDPDGLYASKDVYPVAWPNSPELGLHTLAAIVNGTVFACLYNTVYQGIVVGGETYHYLPAPLKRMPIPPLDTLKDVEALAEGGFDAWLAIDRAVCTAYGIDESERIALINAHLTRVGAPVPS